MGEVVSLHRGAAVPARPVTLPRGVDPVAALDANFRAPVAPSRRFPLRTPFARLHARLRWSHLDLQDRTALVFLVGALWGALLSVGTIAALFIATAGAH